MDDLDRKILALLAKNARMPVKEIAEKVALTSPAVSSRIHKLETDGIISGYTVMLNRPSDRVYVDALISLSVAPSQRDELVELMKNSKEVLPPKVVLRNKTLIHCVSLMMTKNFSFLKKNYSSNQNLFCKNYPQIKLPTCNCIFQIQFLSVTIIKIKKHICKYIILH